MLEWRKGTDRIGTGLRKFSSRWSDWALNEEYDLGFVGPYTHLWLGVGFRFILSKLRKANQWIGISSEFSSLKKSGGASSGWGGRRWRVIRDIRKITF